MRQSDCGQQAVSRRRFLGTGLEIVSGCALAGCACAAMAAGPAGSGASNAPKGRYETRPLGDGFYWVTDGAYSTMFAVSSEGVIACDAPPTLGENYLRAIAEVTDKPVRYLVYSHEHVDHIAGSHLFPATAKVVANRRTAELLASRQDRRRRSPDIVYDNEYVLELGDKRLDLSWRGINHCVDNTFIFARKQKILMFIDVIYPGWMPYKNLGVAVDVPGFVAAHRTALSFDFDTLVAGHVSRPGTREDVTVQLEFLRDLAAACERAYAQLSFPQFLARHHSGKPGWDLHNDYESALVDRVAAEVGPRWRNRLQGFDAYFKDNCWAMLETFVVQGAPSFEERS